MRLDMVAHGLAAGEPASTSKQNFWTSPTHRTTMVPAHLHSTSCLLTYRWVERRKSAAGRLQAAERGRRGRGEAGNRRAEVANAARAAAKAAQEARTAAKAAQEAEAKAAKAANGTKGADGAGVESSKGPSKKAKRR